MSDDFKLVCCECGQLIALPSHYGWMTGNWATIKCRICGTKQEFSSMGNQIQGQRSLEIPRIWYKELPVAVNEEAKIDFMEGVRAFNARCFKSAVVMSRRSIQIAAINNGARGDKLVDQISDLYDNNKIDSSLYHFASGCRQLGNYGAHPQDDELKDVDEDNAKLAIDITYQILDQLYR